MTRTVLAAIAVGTFLAAGTVEAGIAPDALCKEKKAKEAGKKAFGLMKAFGKNSKKPNAAKLAQDISKVQSKFTKGFSTAEAKGECVTSDDSDAIETKVDALVFDIVANLSAVRCGDNVRVDPEECDGTDDATCPGICQANCRCPEPLCGNGVLEAGEECEPPCSEDPPCGSGEICGVTCECVQKEPCNCGTPEPTFLDFSTGIEAGTCGELKDASEAKIKDLDCAISYVGGGILGGFVNEGTGIAIGTSVHKVQCCYGTSLRLTNTTEAETGSIKTCTSKGCFFGAPVVTIGTPAIISVCNVTRLLVDAHGFMDCSTGEGALYLPVEADVHLTSDLLRRRCDADAGVNMGRVCLEDSDCAPGTCLWDFPGHCDSDSGEEAGLYCTGDAACAPGTCVSDDFWQPCPICNPTTLKCNGGPDDGEDCLPQTPVYDPSYPNSQDCQPPSATKIATGHMPYPMTTGTTSLQAPDGQFCGYCRDVDVEGSLCFEGDPDIAYGLGAQSCPDSTVIPDCQSASYHGGQGGSIDGCGPLSMIPCESNAECYAPYETCQQRDPGAFNDATARSIAMWGSSAGSISDRAPHSVTFSGAYCAPATFAISDSDGSMPCPSAASFPGEVQLRP